MNKAKLDIILENHKKWLNKEDDGIRADLRWTNLRGADLHGADLRGADLSWANLCGADLHGADLSCANLSCANLDFSQLNLSCKGLDFKIDERLAKQLVYHVVNLMQYSDLDTSKIFKKQVFKWLEDSHVVTKHDLPILKEKKNEQA